MGFLRRPKPGERTFLYGYNVDEVQLPPLNWVKPKDGELQDIGMQNSRVRPPEMVSLPCGIEGAVAFRPNTTDALSAVMGLKKRLVHERPTINRKLLRRLQKFANKWMNNNLIPLQSHEIPSFEEWVEGVNQPGATKDEYRRAYAEWAEGKVKKSKLSQKKCFVKPEFYPEAKYHRIIHSPTDYEKVLHGRFVKAIEKKVFSLPYFIKKYPRQEWPEIIASRVGIEGLRVYASDYSSFEANFVPEVQRVLELALAKYMLGAFLDDEGVDDLVHTDRVRRLTSVMFVAWIEGRRASGQMATSLFNGFSNLIVNMFFAMEINGSKTFDGVVEGDDGLFAYDGKAPTPEQFLEAGFTIKIIHVERYYEASFCGVVFHPDAKRTLADPIRMVTTASWCSRAYLRASDDTLRKLGIVKGLSYLAQYPGCPVIQSVALWLLRTNGFEREKLNDILGWYQEQKCVGWWDREVLSSIRASVLQPVPVHPGSRQIVAKVFGVGEEIQIALEELFDGSSGSVDVSDYMPGRFLTQWYGYVRRMQKFDRELNMPHFLPLSHHIEGPVQRRDVDAVDYSRARTSRLRLRYPNQPKSR